MCGCAKFQAKQTTFTFSVQICPKMDLGLAIQKTNIGIRRCHAYKFSGKMNNFNFFDENLPKKGFWGRNFKIVSPDSESPSLKYYAHQFSGKTINFEFWIQICSKMAFGVGITKIEIWIWLKWTPPRYHVCQFSVKMDNFWRKFGQISQLRAIFWLKYCWGCCRELGGGWNELGGDWWS